MILLFIVGLAILLLGKLVHFRDAGINRICVVIGAVIMVIAGLFIIVGLLGTHDVDVDTSMEMVAAQLD